MWLSDLPVAVALLMAVALPASASLVPEPGTMSLVLAGVAVMGWLGRRRGQ